MNITIILSVAALLLLLTAVALVFKILSLTGECERLRAEAAAAQSRLQEQKTWVEEQMRFVESKVNDSTSRLIEERGRTLNEQHQRELNVLIDPLKLQLGEFRSRVDAIHTTESAERGKLVEQIKTLTDLNKQVSESATSLTNALTIKSKSTGDWGEMVLERILQDSGLRADIEYKLQHSVDKAEGGRQQPDAVIFLPEQRQVVVDAKASNKAWRDYCDASDEAARRPHLDAHLQSLRAHITGLAARDYPHSPDLNTVDFVLMFVPIEAALLTALSADHSLYEDAYRNKIILVTPSTLMAVVKLVESMWTFEKRKKHSDELAEAGRKLYEKLVSYGESFVEIGGALKKAQDVYDRALGQLRDGRGSATKLAQSMLELGVTPAGSKRLPDKLLAPDSDDQGSSDS